MRLLFFVIMVAVGNLRMEVEACCGPHLSFLKHTWYHFSYEKVGQVCFMLIMNI
jgi:hypothetical protein